MNSRPICKPSGGTIHCQSIRTWWLFYWPCCDSPQSVGNHRDYSFYRGAGLYFFVAKLVKFNQFKLSILHCTPLFNFIFLDRSAQWSGNSGSLTFPHSQLSTNRWQLPFSPIAQSSVVFSKMETTTFSAHSSGDWTSWLVSTVLSQFRFLDRLHKIASWDKDPADWSPWS